MEFFSSNALFEESQNLTCEVYSSEKTRFLGWTHLALSLVAAIGIGLALLAIRRRLCANLKFKGLLFISLIIMALSSLFTVVIETLRLLAHFGVSGASCRQCGVLLRIVPWIRMMFLIQNSWLAFAITVDRLVAASCVTMYEKSGIVGGVLLLVFTFVATAGEVIAFFEFEGNTHLGIQSFFGNGMSFLLTCSTIIAAFGGTMSLFLSIITLRKTHKFDDNLAKKYQIGENRAGSGILLTFNIAMVARLICVTALHLEIEPDQIHNGSDLFLFYSLLILLEPLEHLALALLSTQFAPRKSTTDKECDANLVAEANEFGGEIKAKRPAEQSSPRGRLSGLRNMVYPNA